MLGLCEQNLTEVNSPVSADKEFGFIQGGEKRAVQKTCIEGIIAILKHLAKVQRTWCKGRNSDVSLFCLGP